MRPLAPLALALCALAPAAARPAPPAEEVRLHLALSARPHGTKAEREALRELQYQLAARLAARGAGELVRDEWPAGWCLVVIAAPDARVAWEIAREVLLAAHRVRPGSYAVVRPGGPGTAEERIPLAPSG